MEWGFDYFDKVKFDEKDLYADTFITYGNKYLSEDYLAGQEKHYPTQKERDVRLLGKCIRLAQGEAVYSNFDADKNVDKTMKYELPPDTELVLSFDFNVNPMSCLLGAVYENKIRTLKNFQLVNSRTREMCKFIIEWMKDNGFLKEDGCTKFGISLVITGDSTGESSKTSSVENDYEIILDTFENVYNIRIKIILNHSVDKSGKIHYFNPSVRETADKVDGMLVTGSLIIDAVCDQLIRALEMTPWKQGAEGFTIDENKFSFSHLSPCLRYMVWNLRALLTVDGKKNNIIQTHNREKR